MTPDEARRRAAIAFGGIEQRKEECRDTRRVGWLLDFVRDLRHGARLLARSPMFATAAVLSLGIGIGANVAMFSVVDALLLKKLPVPDPDGLVYLVRIEKDFRSSELSFEIYRAAARESAAVRGDGGRVAHGARQSLGGWRRAGRRRREHDAHDAGDGRLFCDARCRRGDRTDPHRGRRQRAGGSRRQRPFWRTRLEADPDATSRTLSLNGFTFDIVGVTPPGFSGEWVGAPTDVWVPFASRRK